MYTTSTLSFRLKPRFRDYQCDSELLLDGSESDDRNDLAEFLPQNFIVQAPTHLGVV